MSKESSLKGISLQIYDILLGNPGLTVGEIALLYSGDTVDTSGRARNEIAKRVSDLVNWGVVKPVGKTLCPTSNRKANRYSLTGKNAKRQYSNSFGQVVVSGSTKKAVDKFNKELEERFPTKHYRYEYVHGGNNSTIGMPIFPSIQEPVFNTSVWSLNPGQNDLKLNDYQKEVLKSVAKISYWFSNKYILPKSFTNFTFNLYTAIQEALRVSSYIPDGFYSKHVSGNKI